MTTCHDVKACVVFVAPFVQPVPSWQQLHFDLLEPVSVSWRNASFPSTECVTVCLHTASALCVSSLQDAESHCFAQQRCFLHCPLTATAQVWSSSHNSRKLCVSQIILYVIQFSSSSVFWKRQSYCKVLWS